MTFDEAYTIIKNKYPFHTFSTCIEYNQYFVFFKDAKSISPGIAVNKKTGIVNMCRPSMISLEELKNGRKEIKL